MKKKFKKKTFADPQDDPQIPIKTFICNLSWVDYRWKFCRSDRWKAVLIIVIAM